MDFVSRFKQTISFKIASYFSFITKSPFKIASHFSFITKSPFHSVYLLNALFFIFFRCLMLRGYLKRFALTFKWRKKKKFTSTNWHYLPNILIHFQRNYWDMNFYFIKFERMIFFISMIYIRVYVFEVNSCAVFISRLAAHDEVLYMRKSMSDYNIYVYISYICRMLLNS